MMMKLKKFKVQNFRSVEDSGWIEADDVTALIGINESGKTNLLLPLWKLNPAKDGEINLVADAPRKRYNEIKNLKVKPVFIEAYFELTDDLIQRLASLTEVEPEGLRIVSVSRRLDGQRLIDFPESMAIRSLPKSEVAPLLVQAKTDIGSLSAATKSEEGLKEAMEAALLEASGLVEAAPDELDEDLLERVKGVMSAVDTANATKRSTLAPRYGQFVDDIDELVTRVSKPAPQSKKEVRELIVDNLPSFVYYSNYGNLDSEIYLPHVIDNLERDDLGSREEAKARTLKVLFDFVKLEPQEILELGLDLPRPVAGYSQQEPTTDEIEVVAANKKEREILLQSASTDLTKKFRDWWKQGEYRIRFNADGNHFRIWVSDDQRPEEIELEGRSTGLQWFLSFYLIFLVESADAHQGAILLLDEPGLSLHPLAQKDLSRFFESLSETNQLLYTTHSPFLVDSDHLDRVRSVYVNEDGNTVASSNLRAGQTNSPQTKAIYAVHAALGLATSDIMFQGCQPVIVEGTSDQFYLSAIKNYLIREGLINPKLELLFVPAGGVKGVTAAVSILTAKDEAFPYTLLDSDRAGQEMAKKLREGLYRGATDRVLMVGDFCQVSADAEMEDLMPVEFLADVVTKYLRGPEDDFDDVVVSGSPIVSQIEAYAEANQVQLEDGWKVELAKRTKLKLLKSKKALPGATDETTAWQKLFAAFEA